jgi:hypothetical protein
MEEDNIFQTYIDAVNKKNIKNSSAFQVLNKNNIDTHELTNHEQEYEAGTIELNYKDEKTKEVDSRTYVGNALAFIADMPEETVKSLMLAFLNGTDVAANGVGVIFNALTDVDEEIHTAHKNSDYKKFSELTTAKIQEFSKYLDGKKTDVSEYSGNITGMGSQLDNKAAEFVSMVIQDTPYALPIYKKMKKMGLPTYVALPVSYGMGSAIAFDDDATLFLNSEQVQGFKKMTGALPDTSEEKIFNTTFRMLEGTGLGFAIPFVVKSLKFAKNHVPKLMKPQSTVTVGGTAVATAAVEELKENAVEENLKNERANSDKIIENILKSETTTEDNIIGNMLKNEITQSDNIRNNTISNLTE